MTYGTIIDSPLRDGSGTDIEHLVADAFTEILGGDEPIAAGSDFFLLGGDSILGARLVARLRQLCDVKVTMRDVFRARNVAAIAEAIRQRRAAERTGHSRGRGDRGE